MRIFPSCCSDENVRRAAASGRRWRRAAKDAEDAAALKLIRRFRASRSTRTGTPWSGRSSPTAGVLERGGVRARRRARKSSAGNWRRGAAAADPGWTLPGVMTVGAAQIALKTGGLVPSGRTWLAGQGPLLLLHAAQALAAGGELAGILDLSDGFAPIRALGHCSFGALPELRKGLAWRRSIAQSGVRWLSASELRAEGLGALSQVVFRHRGVWRREARTFCCCTTVSYHRCRSPALSAVSTHGPETQRCWYPIADPWGQTSVPGILVAGDGAGVGGAAAAELSGQIAALGAAQALGRLDIAGRDAAAAPLRAARTRRLAARPMLDALFAPRPMHLADETTVCRCEEVSAGDMADRRCATAAAG